MTTSVELSRHGSFHLFVCVRLSRGSTNKRQNDQRRSDRKHDGLSTLASTSLNRSAPPRCCLTKRETNGHRSQRVRSGSQAGPMRRQRRHFAPNETLGCWTAVRSSRTVAKGASKHGVLIDTGGVTSTVTPKTASLNAGGETLAGHSSLPLSLPGTKMKQNAAEPLWGVQE